MIDTSFESVQERSACLRAALEILREHALEMTSKSKNPYTSKCVRKKELYVQGVVIADKVQCSPVVIRSVLRSCPFVIKRPSSLGGYSFDFAPVCLQEEINEIIKANRVRNPIRWVRKYPVTMRRVLASEFDRYVTKLEKVDRPKHAVRTLRRLLCKGSSLDELSVILAETMDKARDKLDAQNEALDKIVFFEYDVAMFQGRYMERKK